MLLSTHIVRYKMVSKTALCSIAAVVLVGVSEATGPCPPSGVAGRYDYQEVLCMSILFYEAQRAGVLPEGNRFPWRGDSALGDGGDVGVDLIGGYFDAGDHVKFGFPLAAAVTILSWGMQTFKTGFEIAGQVAYAEEAIRWATDYMLKTHASDHMLWAQAGDGYLDHAYWGRPEDMTMDRPSFKVDTEAPGSEVAGETAAAFAATAMLFEESDPAYAAQLLEGARDLFSFADQYREMYHVSIPNVTDFYKSFNGYGDELAWAAIWLFKATGEQEYADKAMELWNEFEVQYGGGYGFDWDNKNAGVQVLFAELFGDELYRTTLQESLASVRSMPHTPSGLVFINEWGSLSRAISMAFIALQAADLGIDAGINESWAIEQIHYALGSGGRSYIVGYGYNPPERPHHRGSSCPDPPASCTDGWAENQSGPNPHVLYGAMVGGPDENDGFVDDRSDYVHNEVAIGGNSALVGVLAAMVQRQQEGGFKED